MRAPRPARTRASRKRSAMFAWASVTGASSSPLAARATGKEPRTSLPAALSCMVASARLHAAARGRTGDAAMASRELAEMTWEEVRDLDRARAVAVLPVGAIEAHGPHLALSTDVVIARGMARAGAARLAPRGYEASGLPAAPSSCAREWPRRWRRIRLRSLAPFEKAGTPSPRPAARGPISAGRPKPPPPKAEPRSRRWGRSWTKPWRKRSAGESAREREAAGQALRGGDGRRPRHRRGGGACAGRGRSARGGDGAHQRRSRARGRGARRERRPGLRLCRGPHRRCPGVGTRRLRPRERRRGGPPREQRRRLLVRAAPSHRARGLESGDGGQCDDEFPLRA